MACQVWTLVLTFASSAVEERVVHLVAKKLLPDLEVLPVSRLELQWHFREMHLFVCENSDKITLENLAQQLVKRLSILKSDLFLLLLSILQLALLNDPHLLLLQLELALGLAREACHVENGSETRWIPF